MKHLPNIAPLLMLPLFFAASVVYANDHCPARGVDELLRRCQQSYPDLPLPMPPVSCRQHERQITSLDIDGKTYAWEDFARWGLELFDQGWVSEPPAGPFDPRDPSRSRLISDFPDYSCGRCHNDQREDPILIDQDADARFAYIRELLPHADYRTSRLKMVQGVTMWGGVNRVRFYNGLFSFFDTICVPTATTLYRSPQDPNGATYETVDCGGSRFAPCSPGCRQLDTASFRDAVQTCGRYCGVGRFMEDWEVEGLLTYFWDQQALLDDVVDSLHNQLVALGEQKPLPAQKIAAVEWKLEQLESWLGHLEAKPTVAACQALSSSYLLTSCETLRDQSPEDPDNEACSRDWQAPRTSMDPTDIEDSEDLPAMIRHLLGKNPSPKQVSAALTQTHAAPFLPFVSDDGSRDTHAAEPATEQLRRGKDLYELSCGRCHGASPEGLPQVGGRGHRFLVGSAYVYFKLIEDGLTPKNPIPPNPQDPSQESLYMPEFTVQRLSYQQAEDIYQYLLSLPPSGQIQRQRPE